MAHLNKIDEKLNSMVHAPKIDSIMTRLNTIEYDINSLIMVYRYIELKEMEKNE
jgi:hypothetical protein